MEFVHTGIILNTEHYDDCVVFYRDLFGLPVLHEKRSGDFRLTCFAFGGAYLMVETGGSASAAEKTIEQSPAKLRFNVMDMDATLKRINDFGLNAKIEKFAWGETINICDPDGNRIGIRDEATFATRVETT